MRFIGVLGIIALLGIAWALSYHRRDVKLRIVFWGLGLQFLFAVIILRQDYWSFVGMSALAGLVSVYLLRVDRTHPDRSPLSIAALLTGAAVVGGLIAAAGPPLAAGAAGLCLLLILLNSKFRFAPRLQAPATVLFVASGVAWLIASNIYGQVVFIAFSEKVAAFLSLSDFGARFLFGNLADPQYFFPGGAATWPGFGFQFAFKVLPTILFFGGFMAVLYYLGIMQKVIEALARFMRWTVGTSGAETLSCTANIFVGQTEAPLLIKPFLRDMTRSEPVSYTHLRAHET